MEGKEFEQVTDEKVLGILIDDQLKFHKQTSAATKNANGAYGLLKKSFTLLDNMTRPPLCKLLVRPHLEYGNVVWGSHYAGYIKYIDKVQGNKIDLRSDCMNLNYLH